MRSAFSLRSILSFPLPFIAQMTPSQQHPWSCQHRKLKPVGISAATGQHAHNRMVFKRVLQAGAVSAVQIEIVRVCYSPEVNVTVEVGR